MSDSDDQVNKKEHKVNGQSAGSSKNFNLCTQRLLYEAQSSDSNQSSQTTQEIIVRDIIIETNNDQGTSDSMQFAPARVDNKAAERSRLYRERHREEINERRREVRQRKLKKLQQIQAECNIQNVNEIEQNTYETLNNQLVSLNSRKLRQQRYYERHRDELNRRKRENRLKQNGLQRVAVTAAERNRKYRERNKYEINERRRHSRRQQQYVQRVHAEYGEDRSMSGTVRSPVGRLVESNQADDRKMISLVKQRPLLFARCNMPIASYYSQVKLLWKEVADQMGCGVGEVRRKWARVRSAYSRHLPDPGGPDSAKGSAVHAEDLDFLKDHIATDTTYNAEGINKTEEPVTSPQEDKTKKYINIEVSPMMDNSNSDLRDDSNGRSSVYSWRDAQEQQQEQSASSEPVELNQCWLQESQDPMLPEPGYFQSHENSAYFQFFRSIFDDYKQLVPSKQRLFRRQCLSYLHELLDQSEEPVLVPHAVNLSSSADPSVRNLCTVVKVEPFDNSST